MLKNGLFQSVLTHEKKTTHQYSYIEILNLRFDRQKRFFCFQKEILFIMNLKEFWTSKDIILKEPENPRHCSYPLSSQKECEIARLMYFCVLGASTGGIMLIWDWVADEE